MGMGGFLDGILFHQVLQVHNMMSAWIPVEDLVSAKVNMVWDGLFHAAVWAITAVGIAMLWRAARRRTDDFSNRGFAGALLVGWGLFNLIEGLVDHHLLGVHHVYERAGQSVWDIAFLVWGAAMALAGGLMIAAARTGESRGSKGQAPS
jgi:uncharacterized membrane protein